jgi:endonuclease/exonuclease/phosphatase family metal-dependent hydrolase
MLRLATLNINTGHGARGEFRQVISRRDLEDNLAQIADLLRDEAPDVVCLQEVDSDWRGSCRVEQARWIARRAGYPFVHSCSHHASPLPQLAQRILRKDDVIFTRDCGTAILSRLPLIDRQEYTFGQTLTSNPFVNYFAKLLNESKGYTFVVVEVDGVRVGIMSVHLLNDIVFEILRAVGKQVRGEIFARAWQVEKLIEHVREAVARGLRIVVAGDFNSVPREDVLHHLHSRNGDPDDYRRDVSMYLMREARLLETIPQLFGRGTPQTIAPYHTYPAIDPDRTLDYIFATRPISLHSYRVVPRLVSDHLAVVADLEVAAAASRDLPEAPPSRRETARVASLEASAGGFAPRVALRNAGRPDRR